MFALIVAVGILHAVRFIAVSLRRFWRNSVWLRSQRESAPVSPSIEMGKVALCCADIEVAQPAAHVFNRRWGSSCLSIPFEQRNRCAVA